MSGQTALYRLYDADDELLYIGVSSRFGNRWHQHAQVQPWWPGVDHQTVTWFGSREEALKAEAAAIREEKPLYNIVHNSALRKRRNCADIETGFVVPDDPHDVEVWQTAESLRDADKAREAALGAHVAAALAALRAGRPPTGVANLSPFTDAYIRQLAREAGIPPARKGQRAD